MSDTDIISEVFYFIDKRNRLHKRRELLRKQKLVRDEKTRRTCFEEWKMQAVVEARAREKAVVEARAREKQAVVEARAREKQAVVEARAREIENVAQIWVSRRHFALVFVFCSPFAVYILVLFLGLAAHCLEVDEVHAFCDDFISSFDACVEYLVFWIDTIEKEMLPRMQSAMLSLFSTELWLGDFTWYYAKIDVALECWNAYVPSFRFNLLTVVAVTPRAVQVAFSYTYIGGCCLLVVVGTAFAVEPELATIIYMNTPACVIEWIRTKAGLDLVSVFTTG